MLIIFILGTLGFGLCQKHVALENVNNFRSLKQHNTLQSRIINGMETIPHQYPFQVAIIPWKESKTDFCGGTLISKRYVLTAAHCAYTFHNFTIILGAHNVKINESSQQTFYTNESIVHPRWPVTQHIVRNDIALIKLPREAKLNDYVQLIRLPRWDQNETTFEGINSTAIGWGATEDNEESPVLRHVSNPIESHIVCKKVYEPIPINQRSHICFSKENGRSGCNGDSGGPLIITDKDGKLTQVGITSFAGGCTDNKYPTVYVRVSSYLNFIAENSDVVID